jgi:hypothetical protein
MAEEKNNPQQGSDEWSQFSELVPEREDIVMPDDDLGGLGDLDDKEGGGSYGTLSQRMKNAPKLSDAQTFDLRLNPDLGESWLNFIQQSRVLPDTYNQQFRIYLKTLLRKSKGKIPMGKQLR